MMYSLDSFVSISYELWHSLMQFCFCILHFGLCRVLVCRVSIKAILSVSFREMKIPTAFTRGEMSFWEEFFLCIPVPYHLFLLSRPNLSQPSIHCVSCFHNLIDVLQCLSFFLHCIAIMQLITIYKMCALNTIMFTFNT